MKRIDNRLPDRRSVDFGKPPQRPDDHLLLQSRKDRFDDGRLEKARATPVCKRTSPSGGTLRTWVITAMMTTAGLEML
jgi:hypothetical protein